MRLSMVMICLALVSLYPVGTHAQTRADPEAVSSFEPKALASAERRMIVTAHPLATQAGDTIMAKGGSSADAAIAALLVLNLVEPQSSGIGGGAFALVYSEHGLTSWDARETAPAAVTPNLFLENGAPLPFLDAVASGRSVGVPGLVRLFETLHMRHGRLPWSDLFEPAISLARDGFEISPRLAASIARYAGRLTQPETSALFLPGGVVPAAGSKFRNPAFAETLTLLAKRGARAFYSGALAADIVAATRNEPRPGLLDLLDLADYSVVERAPVCMEFRRRNVCGMGPPSSGATTVGQILGLLDRFKPDELRLDRDRLWHLFAEASRLAYADRARYLADKDFVNVPVKGLLDSHYIAERSRLIDGIKASRGKATAGAPPWREGRLHAPDQQEDLPGTTHLSVIDETGLAISLTASIETAFGSGRLVGGFLLNNQLTDFSFRPTGPNGLPIANAPAAKKRPRSSMAPTIVLEGGSVSILAGSPGGSRIPEYVAAALLAMIAFDTDAARATALPHISQRNRDTLVLEPGVSDEIAAALAARGHDIEYKEMTSGLHIIAIASDGTITGGADPRREGLAAGE